MCWPKVTGESKIITDISCYQRYSEKKVRKNLILLYRLLNFSEHLEHLGGEVYAVVEKNEQFDSFTFKIYWKLEGNKKKQNNFMLLKKNITKKKEKTKSNFYSQSFQ